MNAVLDTARVSRDARGKAGGKPFDELFRAANLCRIQWTGEASIALDAYSVLAYGSALIDPTVAQFRTDALRAPIFRGLMPAADGDNFVITREPIQGQSIGDAVVSGLAVVQVDITDGTHTRAKPIAGTTANLASCDSGGVPIIWSEAGIGMRWAFVLLPRGPDDPAKLIQATPSIGNCTFLAGVPSGYCWDAAVISATGACACLDLDQLLKLLTNGTPGQFLSATNFSTCISSGKLLLDISGDPPTLVIVGGGSGASNIKGHFLGCSVQAGKLTLDFAFGGSAVCNGTPAARCNPDGDAFVIRLTCGVCPNSSYTTPGWYCVAISGCEDDDTKVCQHFDLDPGTDVTLCGGPYASSALCTASCTSSTFPGDPVPVSCDDFGAFCIAMGISSTSGPVPAISNTSASCTGMTGAMTVSNPSPPGGIFVRGIAEGQGQANLYCNFDTGEVDAVITSGGAGTAAIVFFSLTPPIMVIDMVYTVSCAGSGGHARFTIS